MYTFVTRSSFCPLWLTVWSMFDIVPSYTTVKSDYKHNIKYINRERKRERGNRSVYSSSYFSSSSQINRFQTMTNGT